MVIIYHGGFPNPDVPKEPILEAGIKLRIPVLDESETIKFDLPPWKK